MRNPTINILSIGFCIVIISLTLKYAVSKITESYVSSIGVTAMAEGTVCSKQYIAAHTDTTRSIFTSYSQFYPEEWEIGIRRYDSSAKKWETAHYDVDKMTYDNLKVGGHYKDPLNQTAFFEFVS
jgi:hypothetical protein